MEVKTSFQGYSGRELSALLNQLESAKVVEAAAVVVEDWQTQAPASSTVPFPHFYQILAESATSGCANVCLVQFKPAAAQVVVTRYTFTTTARDLYLETVATVADRARTLSTATSLAQQLRLLQGAAARHRRLMWAATHHVNKVVTPLTTALGNLCSQFRTNAARQCARVRWPMDSNPVQAAQAATALTTAAAVCCSQLHLPHARELIGAAAYAQCKDAKRPRRHKTKYDTDYFDKPFGDLTRPYRAPSLRRLRKIIHYNELYRYALDPKHPRRTGSNVYGTDDFEDIGQIVDDAYSDVSTAACPQPLHDDNSQCC